MKWFAALYVAMLHAALAFALLSKPSYPQQHIATMRGVHAQEDASVPARAAVFLGDSTTMALDASEVAEHSVNYGIGFQRSDELLDSMRGYQSLRKAKVVYVAIGINDILQGRQQGIAERYAAILGAIPAQTPVVMSGIPPIAGASTVNESARASCARRTNCAFVDLSSLLADQKTRRPDGIHLSPVGYALWISALRQATVAK
jgi:lysophospholipase L1-like esterase